MVIPGKKEKIMNNKDWKIMTNALLERLNENADLADKEHRLGDAKLLRDAIKVLEDNMVLQQWNNDLMSGMYVNCVYCGHRYGPVENTPTSMADILKEHIEKCPKHPMSKLKEIVERLKKAKLSQIGWEDGEDVVLLNGEPVGMTVTRHKIEFDRFWNSVKAKILGENSEVLEK